MTINIKNKKQLNVKLCFDYDIEVLNIMGHRSGWKNVIKRIYDINNDSSNKTVMLIDIMEKKFCWDNEVPFDIIYYNEEYHGVPLDELRIKMEDGKIVYMAEVNNTIIKWMDEKWINDSDVTLENFFKFKSNDYPSNNYKFQYDWIGILHNPHNMPKWFYYKHSPQCMMERSIYKANIDKCKGIIVLSKYLANWLRTQLPSTIPISVLYHPTDDADIKFDYNKFINNDEKYIIQIGCWLRKFCAIGQFKTNLYKKIWLYGSGDYVNSSLIEERRFHLKNKEECSNLEDVDRLRLDNNMYDIMLSKNICFIYLYDSSANNVIIECIARNTPLLVNKHPAVIEYLGDKYPFYYSTIKEAEIKAHDFSLIYKTYKYLAENQEIHERISYKKFIYDFMKCEVIKNISESFE